MIKLNKYLQPENSPVAQNQGAVSAYEFDSQNERNTVDLSKIKNFSFSQGQGGTLTLGGTANGGGVLVIRDSSGNIIVQGDSSGLTIFDGNLIVKNASNTTIIDTQGIVSTANFATDNVEDNTSNSTTSTSPVNVPGSTLDTFVLTRATKAVIYVTGFGRNIQWLADASVMTLAAVDSIDGTLSAYPLTIEASLTEVGGAGPPYSAFGYNVDYQYKSAAVVADLSAGTHTLNLKYYVTGTGTAELVIFQLGYVLFGS